MSLALFLFSTNSPDPDIELVSTAGYGKNGALCVLQKTIRPQVSLSVQVYFQDIPYFKVTFPHWSTYF